MKDKIIAQEKNHLKNLIKEEMKNNGFNCDLNHIDVSKIDDMSELFRSSGFNGNISEWNVSNVTDMHNMFYDSGFNGDISKWNTSNVVDMGSMFYKSSFNNDISNWDVCNVTWMDHLFRKSPFNVDISNWKPFCAVDFTDTFDDNYNKPYWANYEDIDERKEAIDTYHTKKQIHQELNNELNNNQILEKRIKI